MRINYYYISGQNSFEDYSVKEMEKFNSLLFTSSVFFCFVSSSPFVTDGQESSKPDEFNVTLGALNSVPLSNASFNGITLPYPTDIHSQSPFAPNIYPPLPFIPGPYPWVTYKNRWCIQDVFDYLWCLHGIVHRNSSSS
uniref:Uncharacterized protein n=1 Tax=Trichobilharzia regenti TaxID=157069 RepID=A0AA85JPM6_TRIRE|nr:unnamed protein product [Trichobilharzia regenti]